MEVWTEVLEMPHILEEISSLLRMTEKNLTCCALVVTSISSSALEMTLTLKMILTWFSLLEMTQTCSVLLEDSCLSLEKIQTCYVLWEI